MMNLAVLLAGILLVAVQSTGRAESRPVGATTCMLALSEDGSLALALNRGADVRLRNCGAMVNSSSGRAAVFNRGGTLRASRLCVARGGIAENGGVHPDPAAGCKPGRDFLAGRYAAPAPGRCVARSTDYKRGVHVLGPGTYCGWHTFEPGSRVTLKPGVYVIKGGGWIVGGATFTARRVSLHLADRSIIQFNPQVDATITAPLAGPMKGFAITEARRDRTSVRRSWIAVNAVRRLSVRGYIHLPTRDVVFNRDSKLTARRSAIVADRIRVNEGVVVVRRD